MTQTPRTFSFEFFPPKTPEGVAKLRTTRQQLAQFKPQFFSVTFGAGGTTRDGTLSTVLEIRSEGQAAAPHLSCVGSTRENIAAILNEYRGNGIRHLVALRGDIPSGMVGAGEFRYANELVEFIRAEHGDHFHIEVAAYPEFHPQARSADDDLDNFVRKVRAGADSAITQYFFNADSYFRFVDEIRARGLDIPIVPGIMPISNFGQLCRFSDMCGAEVPRWLRLRMQAYYDDTASIRALGLDVVTELCDRLLQGGAPGLHFYTLNQAGLVSTIWQRLGL
ncbi:methylenetetrahydrofolate reductase [NAD(P)H] [Chromobacterium amazonense]|jgi:methylenetetrahydrofolate reductase (NADPH)|uniref:Methylenetetrahydrofolate reductase n=1 Tax=Chromobacterium amazonense TaxID=1382803 RepID=A0A1S1X8Q6_9NEIS|nr:methylenetetrahydrofolate reductase [NAD(P)H] [Chromobacterium amazonense]KIA81278.1 5,10-methylenetetrahydrofolate reductase [Chromobacterium piscinae]MBM2882882.1 methylenetetrahydrofolate reductase [NAD(P)H] [Chromobacterium amazonense]MDE1713070.1 methylenetetrahydrofolate reductase [NAD(P)H] [Chromobacterium amazonense]MDQ4539648.1 methylenetetrahydrofolate reductase [NAD(P)H] [Chromobacterium amazonense]OHX15947.1 methylenetetrahydrofolate reductase [NAD(P)H] [Chromobacterium amazonen